MDLVLALAQRMEWGLGTPSVADTPLDIAFLAILPELARASRHHRHQQHLGRRPRIQFIGMEHLKHQQN